MPKSKNTENQDGYMPINPEQVKQVVEVPVKRIDESDIIKIEKPGDKKTIKQSFKKTEKKISAPVQAEFKEKALKKQGYILIITEKPQAAEKIASALSNGKERKITKAGGVSYYELERNGKKIIVGCAVGHLFSVAQTKKGTGYPVFDIGWFPNFEVRKKDFTKKYYSTIASLVKGASEIVVATDFDVEGEVIGYNIVRFIANQKDAKRMKFSALTSEEIQNSYDNPLKTIEWGQAIAGETRHFLDWIYGINLSRALMNAIKTTGKFKIMSIGRVQGPALNLIVDKEKQIQAFKSTPYWQIFLEINDGKSKLEVKHNKDITKKQELDKFKKLEGRKAIAETKKTKQTLLPPPPFDLTTLQTEAYKFHSITPSLTLQAAQKLYLGGLISYPRTSSQKIPEAMKPNEILKKLSKFYPKLASFANRPKPIEGSKSDPAHPAIIPTGAYAGLEGYEEKIYNLIVKRFVSCYCNDAKLENKSVDVAVDNLKFSAKGMEILEKGWMNVYPVKMEEKELDDFNGEVNIDKVKIEEKQTQPPNRYSPASILKELEKRNLGTKATRSNIIETLYDRNYIKEKSIQATELGIRLIDSLKKHSPIIIDEKLTREMEKDMDIIRASKHELDKKQEKTIKKAEEALIKISSDFKKQENEIGKELVSANEALWEQEKKDNNLKIKCPGCQKGELGIRYTPRFKSYFIGCSNYPECKQTFPLPSQSLIKKTDKICGECQWPLLLRIKQGKRPWIFCPNPKCPSKKEMDVNGDDKEKD